VKRWIAIGGVVIVIAAALVVIGVGGSDSNPTVPSSTVASAATAMSKLRGYRVAMNGTMSTNGHEIAFDGSGVATPQDKTATLKLRLSDPSGRADELTMDEVIERGVVYMRSAVIDDKLPGDKRWLKVDLARVNQQLGVDPSAFSSDPSQSLYQLEAVSGRVERLGHEAVGGVRTTHYRGTVDMRRYARLAPPERRTQARQGLKRLVSLLGKATFPEDVWIDADHHIRRVSLDLRFHVATVPGNPSVRIQMTEDLYDFGTRFHVTVPADDESFDITRSAQDEIRRGLAQQ
jgi:hypothetical protein